MAMSLHMAGDHQLCGGPQITPHRDAPTHWGPYGPAKTMPVRGDQDHGNKKWKLSADLPNAWVTRSLRCHPPWGRSRGAGSRPPNRIRSPEQPGTAPTPSALPGARELLPWTQ